MSVLVTISANFIYGLKHLFESYSCEEAFRWGFRIKSVRVLMCTYIFLRCIELSQYLFSIPNRAFKATDNVWISWNFSLQDFQFIIVCHDALVCKELPWCCAVFMLWAVLNMPRMSIAGWWSSRCSVAMDVQEAVQVQSQLRLPGEQWQWPSGPCAMTWDWLQLLTSLRDACKECWAQEYRSAVESVKWV